MESLRGIFPKPTRPPKRDFIKENVKNIKRISQRNENERNDHDLNPSTQKSRPTVKSRSAINLSNACTNTIKKKPESRNSWSQKSSATLSRSVSCQTKFIDDECDFKDISLQMPSASSHKANSEIEHEIQPENESDHNAVVSVKTPTKIQLTEVHSFRDASDNNGPPDDKSHRQQNMLVSTDISKSAFPIPSGYQMGKLPKYLVEMKERDAEKYRLDSKVDPNCPPDHTVLSEEERLDTLNIAHTKVQDLIDELNRMPMTSQTMRIKNRQIEIEKELNKLDNIVKIFSRPKVYVKSEKSSDIS